MTALHGMPESEQRTFRHRSRLPERFAPREPEGGKGPHMREALHLVVAQLGADRHILDRCKRCCRTRGDDALRRLLPQPRNEPQPQPQRQPACDTPLLGWGHITPAPNSVTA